MTTKTNKITREKQSLEALLEELAEIKNYLKKLLLIIPEENLKEYENSSKIKKAYQKAVKLFPPF